MINGTYIKNFLLFHQAVEQFGDKRIKEDEEKLAKELELQKVHVKKEDIELLVCLKI